SSATESFDDSLQADNIAQQLAMGKAKDVAAQFKDALIIGADTIVVFNNEILTKPKNKRDAKSMLAKLSGKTHQVYTGVALCKTDAEYNIKDSISFSEKTDVFFGIVQHADIDAYIA